MPRSVFTIIATLSIAFLALITITWATNAAPAQLAPGQTVPPLPTATKRP